MYTYDELFSIPSQPSGILKMLDRTKSDPLSERTYKFSFSSPKDKASHQVKTSDISLVHRLVPSDENRNNLMNVPVDSTGMSYLPIYYNQPKTTVALSLLACHYGDLDAGITKPRFPLRTSPSLSLIHISEPTRPY